MSKGVTHVQDKENSQHAAIPDITYCGLTITDMKGATYAVTPDRVITKATAKRRVNKDGARGSGTCLRCWRSCG